MAFDRTFNMQAVSTRIIRGGSSKGIYLRRDELPAASPERDSVVLRLFGSPDRRQIDGLGGADKLTSKVAVMGPPTRSDCHIDYHFGQVNTELPRVDWAANAGAGGAEGAEVSPAAEAYPDPADAGGSSPPAPAASPSLTRPAFADRL